MLPVIRVINMQEQPKPSARETILPHRKTKAVGVCSFQEMLVKEIEKQEIKDSKCLHKR